MAEYIRRRTTSNMLYDIYEDVVRNILADGKPVHPSLVKNIMLRFEKAINLVPAADVVEVVHGEWEVVHGVLTPGGDPLLRCPFCKSRESEHLCGVERRIVWHYCPNCGVKMDGGKDNATD